MDENVRQKWFAEYLDRLKIDVSYKLRKFELIFKCVEKSSIPKEFHLSVANNLFNMSEKNNPLQM